MRAGGGLSYFIGRCQPAGPSPPEHDFIFTVSLKFNKINHLQQEEERRQKVMFRIITNKCVYLRFLWVLQVI